MLIQEDPSRYTLEIETFKRYNKIMYKIIPYQTVNAADNERPEWLENLIESSKSKYPALCLNSVEFFLKILNNTENFDVENGDALTHIKRLIAFSSTFEHHLQSQIRQGPDSFKNYILKELQNEKNKEQQDARRKKPKRGTLPENSFLVMADSGGEGPLFENKSGYSHCREIIENLWKILENEIDTEQIVERLKDFDGILPKIFSDVVIEDLQNKNNRERQDKAIKKFAIFWKYTAASYPSYSPFQQELPDMVFCKDKKKIPMKKHLALHQIIAFLEDPDPTLRLSCRSWLQ